MDNAASFTPANGLITLSLHSAGENWQVAVSNEGPVLPAELQDRLFDPMVSLGKKNAKQSRLGLGLYVVKLIAEFHEGQVEAANRPDDAGAMFTVSLPLAA